MTDRDPRTGKWVKGKAGGPGRPPRATEEEYREAIKDVVPLERFIRQLMKLAERADRGDSRAFDKICDLLGLHIVKTEMTGKNGEALKVVVEYVNSTLTTTGLSSGTGKD